MKKFTIQTIHIYFYLKKKKNKGRKEANLNLWNISNSKNISYIAQCAFYAKTIYLMNSSKQSEFIFSIIERFFHLHMISYVYFLLKKENNSISSTKPF